MIRSINRIKSKLKNNNFDESCFTEYPELIKTGWLIPGGYGIHCEIYEHEDILHALETDFEEIMYNGWVRKINTNHFELDKNSHRGRALLVLDLKRLVKQCLSHVMIYVDTNNGLYSGKSYEFTIKTARDTGFNLSKLLVKEYEVS